MNGKETLNLKKKKKNRKAQNVIDLFIAFNMFNENVLKSLTLFDRNKEFGKKKVCFSIFPFLHI